MSLHCPAQPWSEEPDLVLQQLETTAHAGLTDSDVATRTALYGPNQLHTRNKRTWHLILFSQFKSLLVLLLAAAAGLAFLFGDWIEGTAICFVILINSAIGFFTEFGAVRSMESLRQFNRTHVTVRRNRHPLRISAEELVPGDIVLIEAGDLIAADLRLLTASRLQANESLLTGESFPVSKTLPTLPSDTILAERANMLYKGTSITRGTAEAVVTATGQETELGQISTLVLETTDEVTPLEKRLTRLARKLIVVTLIVTAFTFIMGINSGKELYLMIETSIALAVAAIPEGLPIIATLALARGMWRMARSNALISHLSAVETLGATNVICTDKTGTLTENKMTLDHIVPAALDRQDEVLRIGALCNKATPEGLGDPIEVALLQAAQARNLSFHLPLVREEAFDSETKRMATVHQGDHHDLFAIKGAPEAIFPLCTNIASHEGTLPLCENHLHTWEGKNNHLAAEGFRLLAFAYKESTDPEEPAFENLTFLGLACFIDPPRSDIRSTLDQCHAAGIRVIMVTGDQAGTANHVAESVHITQVGDNHQAITGRDFHDTPEDELLQCPIFARVTPKDKLDLIDLHQRNGSVVAMTGDGVNDAPALKKADIGIAMGQRGTEVAREASDMVLRDDAFSTIVTAIRQGRVIFDNIRKFIVYLMSCNLSEILIIGLAAGANTPLPLLPLQILFLNMVTDVFPALALGASEGNKGVMNQPPRKLSEPLIGRNQWFQITAYSLLISIVVLSCFALALFTFHLPTTEAVTISFLALALAQVFHVFNMTSRESPTLYNELTRNPWIWAAVLLCLALLAAALFIPLFARTLNLIPPSSTGWCIALTGSLIPLLIGRAVGFFMSRSPALAITAQSATSNAE